MNITEKRENLPKMQNLDEIKSLAIETLKASGDAENAKEKGEIDKFLDEVIKHYASESKHASYLVCKGSEDPMKTAILMFAYPTIRVKETKDADTGIVTRSIEDSEKGIDLADLQKRIGAIGADSNWLFAAEKLNYHLTYKAAMEMGDSRLQAILKSNDNFIMKDISRQIDLGKNPVSNNNLKKTLQGIVEMMLGKEYHIISADEKYLVQVFVKDNGKSRTSVTSANHRACVGYLKKICYRILTDGAGYDVETKNIKKELR